jgi:hypothetical protein
MTDIKTINNKSEDLLASDVIISNNTLIKHTGNKLNKEINRIFGLVNLKSNPYYVLTDILEPESVYCYALKKIIRDKECIVFSISLKGNNNLITKLNNFKRGITDRIKFLTLIPSFPEQTSYVLTYKTFKSDNSVKFSNIIEYQNKINNFSYKIVSNLLKLCRYKLLLKINSITITHSNVFLNIDLVRILPESLDPLESHDKLHIINELNYKFYSNILKYNNLEQFIKKEKSSKTNVKTELKKILHL